jgi:hypothetical protein
LQFAPPFVQRRRGTGKGQAQKSTSRPPYSRIPDS